MRKTIMSAAAVASAAALLLTACSSDGNSSSSSSSDDSSASAEATDEATEDTNAGEDETEAPAVRGDGDLVIWADEGKAPGVEKAAKAYGDANGITVTVQTVVNVRQDVVTANEAGNGPDVFVGAHDWMGQLVANGTIDPLTLTADQLSGFNETAVKAVTYDGQLYALPYGIESLLLYCNSEFAPDTYATFEDMVAAGNAAKDAGQVEMVLSVSQGVNGDPYNMQPFYTSAGGYLFGETDGQLNPNDLGVGTEAGIKAGEKIGSLGDKGEKIFSTSVNGDNYISLFTDKKAACLASGPWALNDVETALGKDGYTIQAIPGFEGMDPAAPFMGVNSFYVTSKGANKAYGQDFVTSTQEGGMNTEANMKIMQDTTRQPSAMNAVLDQADDILKQFAEAAVSAQPMPSIPAMDAVWSPLGQAYAAIIGGADASASMTSAAQTIEAAIASS